MPSLSVSSRIRLARIFAKEPQVLQQLAARISDDAALLHKVKDALGVFRHDSFRLRQALKAFSEGFSGSVHRAWMHGLHPDALTALSKATADELEIVAGLIRKEPEAAQDILQEGFIKVYKNIKHFRGSGSLEGWLRKIFTNTVIDYFRKNNTLSNHIISGSEVENEEVPSHILEQIDAEAILVKVGQLPEGARVIFNLYALEGYTHKEISERLNISEGTSKSQLNRAKSILKKWLEEFM